MKFPARFIAGNLIWTRDGTVWAVWAVEPTTYAYLSPQKQLDHHALTRNVLLALPAESMILSLCARRDPEEVYDAIVDGVDLDACPSWADTAERNLSLLTKVAPYRRLHFLAAQLPNPAGGGRLRAALASAGAGLSEAAGGLSAPVGLEEILGRRRQAAQLLSQLEASLELRAATSGEVRWIYARSPRRGLAEPYLDGTWEPELRVLGDGDDARVAGPSLVNLGDGVFKEGGVSGDAHRPHHRRYLRVETEGGVSYQAFLAMSDMPHQFVFPGGAEWFKQVLSLGVPVDWCCRVRSVNNADAQVKARKQARQLAGQAEEYEGEPSGPPESLAEAQQAIGDLKAHLSANPADPELQCTIMFATWAKGLDELERQVALLRSTYVNNAYDLHRPTGGQLAMFTAMLPGSPLKAPVRDYVSYLLAEGLAAGAPFAGAKVGSDRGMLAGWSSDTGMFSPVLVDPTEGSAGEGSGSMGVNGLPGNGKSYLIKRMLHSVLERGGRACAVDRTAMAEYVRFAKVAPGRSQVVELHEKSGVCLDPLRVFQGDAAVSHTLGFLTLLTGVSPLDVAGIVLEEAVGAVSRKPDPSMPKLLEVLAGLAVADKDHAGILHRKLVSFSKNPLGALVFGNGEILDLADADYICFAVPGLDLPDREHLVQEHLFRQLQPRQILSQALLYLVAAVAHDVVFSSTRFGVTLLDEAWSFANSPPGLALMNEAIRNGRKQNAALWVVTHHPDDLDGSGGDKTISQLLDHRIVFCQSKGSSRAAAEFLGLDSVPGVLAELEPHHFLYRDPKGRVGRVVGLQADDPKVDRAFDTNPVRRAAADAEDAAEDAAEEAGRLAGLTAARAG